MSEDTEVLYNGSCPVCSREVNHYARLSADAALPIRYDDLDDPDKLACWGLDKDTAAKRFHVRKGGQVISGIPAFVALWSEIPKLRWLARIVSLPGVYWLACRTYDLVLAPALFAWHKRRMRKRAMG